MRNNNTKYFGVGCICILFFFIFVYFLDSSNDNTTIIIEHSSDIKPLNTPATFRERATNFHKLRKEYLKPENQHTVGLINDRCSHLTQHDQLIDEECTAVWVNKLKTKRITDVERWWGFGDTHMGAITIVMGDTKAMFKPCSSKSEDTSKEVIASYLDQLLQWGQTAPVATRRIPTKELEQFIRTDEDFAAFNSSLICTDKDGFFVGPMIGWWDSLIPIRTINKKDLPVEELLELRTELGKNLLTTQMQSKYHAFYLLINILRHGKDEFITKYGNLVSLDLDRSRYQSTKPLVSKQVNYTWCFTCYMDKWVYDTFEAVGPSQPESFQLGYLMREALSEEDIFGDIWSTNLAVALNTRVKMLLDCINGCIKKYGKDNVLLDVPRTLSDKELVEWFVLNSEYKNMNGKRGPSNLDFLNDL